jgi:hypothetical protein
MQNKYEILGDNRFAPAVRATCALILPIVAFVQFFVVNPLWLAILVAIIVLLVAAVGWSAQYVYEFDAGTKKMRKAVSLFGVKRGIWYDLKVQCSVIAFLKYDQNYTFHFLNLYDTHVDETVFTVHLINEDGSFQTLVETARFESVANIIQFCKDLSEIYEVPFKDYVKSQVMRHRL